MAGLTDTQVKKAKPADAAYRIADSGGLFVFITPAGGKLWRLRYRFNGKEKTLSLGAYPDVSLLEARSARDEAKKSLKSGRDPSAQKRIERLIGRRQSEETFETIAREWHALQKPNWVERHADDVLSSLEDDVFPDIGPLPLRNITAPIVLAVLRQVEQRGAKETARRLRQRISAIFVYAIATGRAEDDPAATVLKAMAPMVKGKQPAVVELGGACALLRATEAVPSHPVTKLAIRLLALTAVRPGTLAATPWAEFADLRDADNIWQIPAARMKLKLQHKEDEERDHLVPLSTQAIETIEVLRKLTGRGTYVFPNGRHAHKPMSENAMGYLINRDGYHHKHVPHGFRSTFSTIMNERYPADRFMIDLMLAHVPKDQVEAAYNRARYLARRKELAQIWADLILPAGSPTADALLAGPRKILTTAAGE
jgi:integrase